MVARIRNLKHSLVGKAIVLFLVLVAIPALLAGLIGKKYFLEIVLENASETYDYSLENLQSQLAHELLETKMNAYYVYLDLDLKQAITRYIDDPIESINAQRFVESKLENYRISSHFSNVNAIKVFGFNGIKMSFGDRAFTDAISDEWVLNHPLYDYALAHPDEFVWSGVYQGSTEDNIPGSLSLFRVIKDRSYRGGIGMLYVNLDSKLFSTVVASYNNRTDGHVFVLDSELSPLVGGEVPSELLSAISEHIDLKRTDYSTQFQQGSQRVYVKVLSEYNWITVGVLDLDAVTDRSYHLFGYFTWGFVIFLFTASFFWLSAVAKLLAPIRALRKATRRVRYGDFAVQATPYGRDELGELTKDFNFMVSKIGQLIESQIAQKEREKDAEYRALQAQINPHFLYNTLNSIRWMAIIQKADNIKMVIESLARLLRNSTNKMDSVISVAEEISILKDYVEIELVAYNSKFSVTYQIDDSTLGCQCLKFLLQPLVENAIFHGVLPSERAGEIMVEVKRVDESIWLRVVDNGVGFDSKDETPHGRQNHFNSIGLDTLRERLDAHYSNQSSLIIDSVINRHTSVTVVLPAREVIC
ncbi:sensor histidine kinase [Vibrio maritimus]|uniref:sensor histidine kinase n=1 Tax=Vibrio maritimus TaxID=990268 RepID=UPI0037359708